MPALTARAGQLTDQFGDDPMMDTRVLLIRNLYAKLLSEGYSDAEARFVLEKYAEHLVKGGTEAGFMAKLPGILARMAPHAHPVAAAPAQQAVPVAPPQQPAVTPIRSQGGRAKPRTQPQAPPRPSRASWPPGSGPSRASSASEAAVDVEKHGRYPGSPTWG